MESEKRIYGSKDLGDVQGEPEKLWGWKDNMEALARENPEEALKKYKENPEWWNYQGIKDAADKAHNEELAERLETLRQQIAKEQLETQDKNFSNIKTEKTDKEKGDLQEAA